MRIKLLALALSLVLLLCFYPLAPAEAAVGMSPSQGTAGTDVTISDLTSGASYIIKWDGTDYKTGTVPSNGIIYFTLADASGGSHTVVVESPGGTQVFTGSFTVLPAITIDPDEGSVKDDINIEGTGFAADEDEIKVTFGGTAIKGSITADENGSWSTTIKVPSSVAGDHTIDASGSTTDEDDVADKTFTVSPGLTVSPTTGGVGTSVTVTGSAFGSAESNIEVTYDDKDVRTGIVADVKGSWSTTFTVPNSTKGSHVIDASGDDTASSDVPDVTFTVLPRTIIETNEGYVGDEIEVRGSGFANDEDGIKITFDGVIVSEKSIDADEFGNWSAALIIPAATNGEHAIDAYGNTTIAADVLDSTIAIKAQIMLNPKFGSVGEVVSIQGTGFSKTKDVIVDYGTISLIPGLTTDVDGSFASSFKTPQNMSGDIPVTATDADDITASAKFSVETTPPDVPRIAAPKDGSRIGFIGDVKVKFDWSDVSDPSGVSYVLEISTTPNFADTLLKVDKLTRSEYTLTEAESLSYGEYYWRVRAIDEAGNSSEWTTPSVVKSGYMTFQTLIIIIAAIIGLTIIATLLPWIIRRIIKAVKQD